MTADKKGEAMRVVSPPTATATTATNASAASSTRKPWVPKTPVDVVLDQIRKQEKKVAELQKELDAEKITLNKLLQAKKVLEA
jgi:hypothetical protein